MEPRPASSRFWRVSRLAILTLMIFSVVGLAGDGNKRTTTDPAPDPAPQGHFERTVAPTTTRVVSGTTTAAAEGISIEAAPAPPPPGGTWTPQGPGPSSNGQVENVTPDDLVVGAIHTLVAHPTDPQTLWVGSVNGGIWRTNDAYSLYPTWTPLTPKFPGYSIGALELDPTDATNSTLVAGIGGFSSWGDLGPLTGLLRTTDGGASWTMLGEVDLAGVNVTGVAPRGNTILVSASTRNGGISAGVHSCNVGTNTCTDITGLNGLGFGSVMDMVGDPGNNNRLYVGIRGTGLFRTDDLGANWTNITGTTLATITAGGNTNIEFAVHNNTGAGTNAVYVGIVNNGQAAGFFRSPDLGVTWTAMDIPQTNEGTGPWGIQPVARPGSQGATHFSMAADPNNANIVYVGGDRQPHAQEGCVAPGCTSWPNSIGASDFSGRLFRGDASIAPTGGVPSPQWTPLTHSGTSNNSSPHADSREMRFDAGGDLIEVDDGGIFAQDDPSTTNGKWFSLVGNLEVTEFHDIAYDSLANVIIGGCQDTGVPEQDGTGTHTWRSVRTADGGDVAVDDTSLFPLFSIRYFSTQNLGGFRRRGCDVANTCGASTLVGLNVTSGAPFGAQFATPLELNVTNPTRLILGGSNGVYESSDQGDNIAQVSTFGVNYNAMAYGHANNPDLIVVGSGASVRIRTTAAGAFSNASATGGGTVTDLVLDPSDDEGIVTIDSNQVFRTIDQGGTWNEITGNITDDGQGNFQAVEYIEGVDNDLVVVGTNAGVMASVEPNFSCWFELGGGLPETLIYDLEYDPEDDLLVAGTMGRSAWTLSGLSTFTKPTLTVPGGIDFGNTCVGETATETLDICNTGKENLHIEALTSSDPQFEVTEPSSGYPVVISPDFCFPFQVQFSPTSMGPQSATLTVESNDPCQKALEVELTGEGGEPRIATVIANGGSFGDVCKDTIKDLDLTISNSGDCALIVDAIVSSDPANFDVPGVLGYPLVIGPQDSLRIPLRHSPNDMGPHAGTFTIFTNDPGFPAGTGQVVNVSGNTPYGDVRITGSSDFGNVCAGVLAEKEISVCNVGLCNLSVLPGTGFDPPCDDFKLINKWFPAMVSPDFCMNLIIRFTPQSVGDKSCTLKILTDDPDQPVTLVPVTGTAPAPMIDVPPDIAFPPEVIQSVDSCVTQEPFPISNTGICPLEITNVVPQGAGPVEEYFTSGLPSFPILLDPGHIAGSGDLSIDFRPQVVDRARLGTVDVTYVSDPFKPVPDTTVVTKNLCGEGVFTGARVLVTEGGVPVDLVKSLKIQRLTANRNKDRLDSIDTAQNLPLMSSPVLPAPCGSFQYHREYGTVSNPVQLSTGSYQVTAQIRTSSGQMRKKSVGFNVDSCDFNPTIIIDF